MQPLVIFLSHIHAYPIHYTMLWLYHLTPPSAQWQRLQQLTHTTHNFFFQIQGHIPALFISYNDSLWLTKYAQASQTPINLGWISPLYPHPALPGNQITVNEGFYVECTHEFSLNSNHTLWESLLLTRQLTFTGCSVHICRIKNPRTGHKTNSENNQGKSSDLKLKSKTQKI